MTTTDKIDKTCKTETKETEKRECCNDDCEVCVDDNSNVTAPPAPELP